MCEHALDTQPPKSGNDETVIKTINIDVSKVTNAQSLVDAIVEQANPILTNGGDLDHYYRVAQATEKDNNTGRLVNRNGVLTVYDKRTFDVSTLTNLYQVAEDGSWKGARIADGVIDDVIQLIDGVTYTRKMIIQDTDKASMNLQIEIPDTRLKGVFYKLDSDKESIYDYSLTIKEDRIALLGKPPQEEGILDIGLDYLLDAAVLVGTQRERLEHDYSKLVMQSEDETFAEIVLSNADIAKEMTEYTKLNILTQSAQAMLAQANRNSSQVLNLLQ